jgi:hypothetical protein
LHFFTFLSNISPVENLPLPPEIVQEAEALLGREMPGDPESKAFEQWLLQLYEEDAGLAAALVEELERRPSAQEAEPGVMEQERRRMQRQEAWSRWWQRLWNVENQYGEWVPNQKRRLAAGFVAVALAFGVFLLVIGQKPLEERKVQGSLGSLSGLVAGQGDGSQTPGDAGADAALLPEASDRPEATTLLGASTGASTGASADAPSSAAPAGHTGPTPGFTTADPPAASGQAPADDFRPRVYPPAAPTTPAGAADLRAASPGQTASLSPATGSASALPADQPPIPSQPVPVLIRQPAGQLPTPPQYVTTARPSPALAASAASAADPEAIQGGARAAPTASVAMPRRTPLVAQNQTPGPWQAVRPTAADSSVALASSAVSGYSAAAPPARPSSAQGTADAGASYSRVTPPVPSSSNAVAFSRPTQPAPTGGQMVQLPRAAPPTPGSAQSPQPQPSEAPAAATGDAGDTGHTVSPLSLPSLQTPTNLAQGFLAGLDPSKPLEATLDTNLLLVEGVSVLARASTPDGTVWLGQASLDPLRRVSIQFKEVIQGAQRIPVSALAYDAQHSPGLAAEFKDENPSLVQDLLRQGAQAANGYLQSLLQSSQTTAVPGGGAVQDRSAPPLEWVLLGELGKLFTLPQPQNSFVRTARVARGTPVLIYLSPAK